MSAKPKPSPWFQQIVDENTPKKRLLRNCVVTFISGGALCTAAELAHWLLVNRAHISDDLASSWVILGVITLTGLLTGIGIYDKLGQKLGAGLAVPISGFANSVASAMLEHKYEGMVMGSGCNSFKLAGAVVVFGVAAAFLLGLLLLILGLL